MTTVSAAVSVMPCPPARVDSRNTKPSEPSAARAHAALCVANQTAGLGTECGTASQCTSAGRLPSRNLAPVASARAWQCGVYVPACQRALASQQRRNACLTVLGRRPVK